MSSLADKIRAKKCATKIVEVEGDSYLLKRLTTSQMALIAAECRDLPNVAHAMQVRILAMSVCDPDTGLPVIDDPKVWEDLPFDFVQHLLGELTELGNTMPSSGDSEKK